MESKKRLRLITMGDGKTEIPGSMKGAESKAAAEAGRGSNAAEVENPWLKELAPALQPERLYAANESKTRAAERKPTAAQSQPTRLELEFEHERFRQAAAFTAPDQMPKLQKDYISFLQKHDKASFEQLRALDAMEAQLLKMGKKGQADLQSIKKIKSEFFNPYGNLKLAADKLNMPLQFPQSGSPAFGKGPFLELPTDSGVQTKAGENFRFYFKDRKDPLSDLYVLSKFKERASEFPELRQSFGLQLLTLKDTDQGLQASVSIHENNEEIPLSVDLEKGLKAQFEEIRKSEMQNLARAFNLDFQQENSVVFLHGRPSGKTAKAPSFPQLVSLGQALKLSYSNFPLETTALKVIWTDFGPAGRFEKSPNGSTIFISTDLSHFQKPGWDISIASYVALHELGHYGTSSLPKQEETVKAAAQSFGWRSLGLTSYLEGEKGEKFCFAGLDKDQNDPMSVKIDLDQWKQGCPIRIASFLDNIARKLTDSEPKYPTLKAEQVSEKLKKKAFSGYFWNEEETVVDALTAYQAGPSSRARLLSRNAEFYEQIKTLDNYFIQRRQEMLQEGPLLRTPLGTLEADSLELREAIKSWEAGVKPEKSSAAAKPAH